MPGVDEIMQPSENQLVGYYCSMRRIRRFEERVVEPVNRNEITGTMHEYVGEEAVATGVCHALRIDDVITFRG